MVIFPLGASSFKLQTPTATILLDPHDGSNGLRAPRAQADMTLLTQKDGRNPDAGGQNSIVVDGPGEYEIKGTAISGIPAATGDQTFYLLESEGLRLAHLGDLNRPLQDSEIEAFDGVDVLFIPVGGHGVLDARKAQEVISGLEPRIVIPMHVKTPGLKVTRDPVAVFCKEFGVKDAVPQDKLRLTRKELPVEETKVIILHPNG